MSWTSGRFVSLGLGVIMACMALIAPGQTRKGKAREKALKVDPELLDRTWTIDGVKRQAYVHPPKPVPGTPASIFIFFHGHGSTSGKSTLKKFHQYWPEAIVAYPQGLPSFGHNDPEGKQPGWQRELNDYGGRDIKFFDEMVSTLAREYHGDPRHVFVAGFSNGAIFLYNTLWPLRGKTLAAMAPCAGIGNKFDDRIPIPVIHCAGRTDPLAKFDAQLRTVEAVRKLNGCESEGRLWNQQGDFGATYYKSATGAPVIFAVHGGGHRVPEQFPPLIVKFFKECQQPVPETTSGK